MSDVNGRENWAQAICEEWCPRAGRMNGCDRKCDTADFGREIYDSGYRAGLEAAAKQVDQCSLFNEGLHRAKTDASVALDVAAKLIRALAEEEKA